MIYFIAQIFCLTSAQIQTVGAFEGSWRDGLSLDAVATRGGNPGTMAAEVGPIVQTVHEERVAAHHSGQMAVTDLREVVLVTGETKESREEKAIKCLVTAAG